MTDPSMLTAPQLITAGIIIGYTREGSRRGPSRVTSPRWTRRWRCAWTPNLPQWQSQSDTDSMDSSTAITGTRVRVGGFNGFTLTEQMILNRYRRRSA